MIKVCANPDCKNVFQVPRGTIKEFCSKYCRFTGFGRKGKSKTSKVKKLMQGKLDADKRSEDIKHQMKSRKKNG